MTSYLPELTVNYKTFLKTAVQQALAAAFDAHPDQLLATHQETDVAYGAAQVTRGTKITLDFPRDKDRYPVIVIRFYERNINRLGTAHEELIQLRTADSAPTPMMHNIYDGDLEFSVNALSTVDRDLISDSLVQVLTMGKLQAWTNHFMTRLYGQQYDYALLADADITSVPLDQWNFVQINHDTIQGFGETEAPAPWEAEDDQIYTVNYRVAVLGEFYSVPPANVAHGLVEAVDVFPYIEDLETEPTGDVADSAEWQ